MSDTDHAPLPHPSTAVRLPPTQRRRLAALSLLGTLMVALPLAQVLRYQNAELEALASQRAGLDPMARTVEVQRSLLLHRDLAGKVLRGQPALEPERRVRQVEVDDRVTALALALSAGAWERAAIESDALREDWVVLCGRVLARTVNATDSDRAHGLLVEQALQVMDLLADATMPGWNPVDEAGALALARSVARQAAQAAARGSDQDDGHSREAIEAQFLRAEAALQTQAVRLAQRSAATARERMLMLGTLALLALAVLALAARLARGSGASPETRPCGDDAPPNADRQETDRLLQRLRSPDDCAMPPPRDRSANARPTRPTPL